MNNLILIKIIMMAPEKSQIENTSLNRLKIIIKAAKGYFLLSGER